MANAAADKLKDFGIRHGEKVVVGLTATCFVVFTALAVIRPTLDIKAEQLNSQASEAGSNLQKQQDVKDILAKLEKDGLKDPDFEKVVENQLANALKPGDYRTKVAWVTPEPGAGLIRDQPDLIAPTDLYAFPGRGGILMYALDDKGDRKNETPEDAKKKPARPKRRGGGMPGMMPGMGGSAMRGMDGPGGPGGPPAAETPEAKKRREADEEKRKALFTGAAGQPKEKGKEEADPAADGPWKEETKGKRWVVITGVIDNAKLKKNYLLALKNEAIAYPNYKRLDVERQSRQPDGTWTEWAATDQDKNFEVIDNLPEQEPELVPENQRPGALVDPLPFLQAGYWTGVHVARLVPPEVLEPPKAASAPGGGRMPGMGPGMMGGGSSGGMDSAGMSKPGMRTGGSAGPGMMPGMGSAGGRGAGMPGMGVGEGGGPAGSGGAGLDDANFTKYDEASLMLRSLDFTVEPDSTYRFRVRIVVFNPNKDHDDVNPGVDTTSKNLVGPWSEPTDEVTVPADVAAYAQAPETNIRRDDQVSFQVIRWDPASGQTLIKNDVAGPGEIVGEYGSVPMPNSEGGGAKPANIDFNSRAIVLDTLGGRQKLPDIGVERIKFEVPAVAMLVEPDGSVVIRSQARDKADDVRDDMENNYRMAIEDSTKSREPGGSSRMPGSGSQMKKKKKKGRR